MWGKLSVKLESIRIDPDWTQITRTAANTLQKLVQTAHLYDQPCLTYMKEYYTYNRLTTELTQIILHIEMIAIEFMRKSQEGNQVDQLCE